MKKADLTAQMVIDELQKLGFSNIKDFAEAGNKIKDISELPDEITAAVESIQTGPKGTKLKLYDKKAALGDLGRHFGIFEKDNAQKPVLITDTLTEEELKKRLAAVEAAGNGIDQQSIGEGY
jgi:phage terminase small subunit